MTWHFNPRSPCGERPWPFSRIPFHSVHFNPRSPCGERRIYPAVRHPQRHFNPRSPCGERPEARYSQPLSADISIHAPRAGSDVDVIPLYGVWAEKFQSTLPVRGATITPYKPAPPVDVFQSTLPVRGATITRKHLTTGAIISIHAPRAGSDVLTFCVSWFAKNFNPRSPCGERPVTGCPPVR